ncbi:MAG: hypothetical protein Kow001_15340 [Acidobacteriota bacterium]
MTGVGALVLLAGWAAAADLHCPPGWEQEGGMRSFSADTLFEYMNGNAEGYLIYGFREMAGVTCRRDEVRVHIDVSEMDGPESAWGLYASNRNPAVGEVALGAVGQVMEGRAFFARDRFFAELAAEPAMPAEALQELASFLDRQLTGGTGLPAALSWFPAEGIRRETLRMVPQSVLGISQLRRGFVAEYQSGARAVIVMEESAAAAAKVMEALRQRWAGDWVPLDLGEEGIRAQDRYLGSVWLFRKGAVLAGGAAKDPAGLEGTVRELERALP